MRVGLSALDPSIAARAFVVLRHSWLFANWAIGSSLLELGAFCVRGIAEARML